jgi:hypothetical protein
MDALSPSRQRFITMAPCEPRGLGPRIRGFPKAAAFHEAAHAVARLHVMCAPLTAVEITRSGAGLTYGSTRPWAIRRSQALARKLILCALAGSYAEACVSRRPLARILTTAGCRDVAQAAPAFVWLVKHRYARTVRSALDCSHWEVIKFLALHWPAIESVAQALRVHGRLSGRQVRKLARDGASHDGKRRNLLMRARRSAPD